MKVSIILPTYNETGIELRLETLLVFLFSIYDNNSSSDEWVQKSVKNSEFEILIADDSDGLCKESLKAFCAAHPSKKFQYIEGENVGKGSALFKACRQSTGEIVFFMDSDFVIPLEHINDFCRMIRDGNDAIIGERSAKRNLMHPFRRILSMGLLLLQRFFIFQSFEFEDTQCGFKAFKGDLIRAIASIVKVSGGMIDIELLYILKTNQKKIQSVRVITIQEIRPTRIKLTRCFFHDPFDLIFIKWRGLTNQYQLK